MVAPGESKNFEVITRNNLSYPVRIGQIETACGCITVGIDKPTISPNSTTAIAFTFVVPNAPGKTEKMIVFQAATSSKTAWFVNVSADVFANFWSVPHSFRFVNSYDNDLSLNTQRIRVTSSDLFSVSFVVSDLPCLNCTVLS
jgi:hypothetical protein